MGRKKKENAQEITDLALNNNYSKYSKSNFLIGAKYKSTLLENQILAISLSNAKEFHKDEKGILVSTIKAKDIINILNKNSGSFYNELASVADSMTSRTIGMIDPEKKVFDYISVVIRAKYESGKFQIYYNPYIENYLVGLEKNFTKLSLGIMASFKTVYAFRLYELIKSQCYYVNKVENVDGRYVIAFNLSELKLNLGVVNSNLDEVQSVLRKKQNPDYDKAVEASPEKTYEDWREFKRCVLDASIKEINGYKKNSNEKLTDMVLKYDTVKSGRGGKVCRVIFTADILQRSDAFMHKGEEGSSAEMTIEDKDNFIDELSEVIQEHIKIKDLRAIAEAANYNMDIIKEKYEMSKYQDVDSLVGWIIAAIKNDYSEPVPAKAKKKSKPVWETENHQYDFSDLEKMLLEN